MKLGIVGLPNVGKSTLFNALTSPQNAQAANYPFCTIEPNSGIVPVPDPRLDKPASRALFLCIPSPYSRATASISTNTSLGRRATSTAERAG